MSSYLLSNCRTFLPIIQWNIYFSSFKDKWISISLIKILLDKFSEYWKVYYLILTSKLTNNKSKTLFCLSLQLFFSYTTRENSQFIPITWKYKKAVIMEILITKSITNHQLIGWHKQIIKQRPDSRNRE